MRAISLLDIFMRRVPASPLLPAAVGPLLAALVAAARPGGDQALSERLSGLIKNRLCKGRAEGAGVRVGCGGRERG
jgi:DNA polymerase phi